MKDKRFCCRCEEVLMNGFYFHNSEVGICNRCVTDLAIQLIKNEDKEVINALRKILVVKMVINKWNENYGMK